MNKIYINARFLTQHITGVQRFAIELSKQLKCSPLGHLIRFVAPQDILHKELAEELQVISVGKRKGHVWEQVDLVKYLNSQDCPLLVNLANSGPVLYSNSIVTIHDLSVFYNPSWFSFFYRTYYQFLTPLIIKKSCLIFTVSNAMKAEIQAKFKVTPEKIEVLYNAVADKFKQTTLEGKRKNIILTVSSLDPRKNIKGLILAFTQSDLKDHELYIIGGESSAFAKTELVEVIQNDDRIKLLGRVPDEELLLLYSKAKLFAYTSFYEGFGLPNLEAMAMGTPVLTSNINSIKEVCGDAAYYVNPHQINSISAGIVKLVNSPDLLAEMSSKGVERSRKYSWSTSANKFYNAISKFNTER